MGKTIRNREGQDDDAGHQDTLAWPKTISVYRHVRGTPKLGERLRQLQDYIDHAVGGTERITLGGLRLVLLPPNNIDTISLGSKQIRSIRVARQAIAESLKGADNALDDLTANKGVVLSGPSNSFAAFAFSDQRLIQEQDAVYGAVGLQRADVRMPLMALCKFPRIEYDLAKELAAGLSLVARNITISAGAIDYDIRGHR